MDNIRLAVLADIHGNYVALERCLEYDVERVIRELQDAKLEEHAPYWSEVTKHILRKGNVTHFSVLARAMELCKIETGDCVWPDIPESCWAQATEEILNNL